MITKAHIKEKSEKLNIPFKNLLSAAVLELIVEILADGKYCNELYLCNYAQLNPDYYKNNCVTNVYYEYVRDLDEKMAILYMRDVLKEIITKSHSEGFAVNGSVYETGINLSITVDSMYIPLHIYFKKHKTVHEPETFKLNLIAYENRSVDVLINPKEEELSKHLLEIIEKLELINDMDHYYEAYEILITTPVNGRKVRERLVELLAEKSIKCDNSRIEMLKGYTDYTYMKKKWKVELRQLKKTEPNWEDVNNCLVNFMEPIWLSIERNVVFLGDWMPQLKRFLD